MAKVIDLTNSDGDLVVIGRAIVLPNSTVDSQPHPLNGSLRFNPSIGAAQLFHAGAWITLGEGGGSSGGDGSSNNHTHTIAQITGLQNILNGKAATVHTHPMTEIVGLVGALSGKSDISHTHSIPQISGLRGELDSKAAILHSHNYSVRDTIAGCFPASPPANYKLVYTAAIKLTFPANFAGSFVSTSVAPAMSYTISLFKNKTTSVGSLIFYPSGQITMNLPTGLELAAGDTLTFQCPARDTAINTISFSFVGTRETQVTT
jgi:hypothetical protein